MRLLPAVNWKDFLGRVYNKSTDIPDHAATVAFYFSFAFFPLLLFLVSLFGIILESTEGLRNELYGYLAQIMPASAYDLVHKTLNEIIENGSRGKLTLGLFVTLWSASAGADSIRTSLNSVYEVNESRAWWNTKLRSLILTFLFIVLIAVVLTGVTYGWQLVDIPLESAGLEVTSAWVLVPIQWAAILLVMIFATSVIYSWIPCFDHRKWLWITPGAIVAIILWLLFTGGFRLYLAYFNTYNKAYGSLGAVIILMLWMYLTAAAILIGGAINSVLTEMEKESGGEDKETGPDAAAVSEHAA